MVDYFLDGGDLLGDVGHGVGEPLIEADGSVLVGIHLVEVLLAGGDPRVVSLEHGRGGRCEAEATRRRGGALHHGVELEVVHSAIPKR